MSAEAAHRRGDGLWNGGYKLQCARLIDGDKIGDAVADVAEAPCRLKKRENFSTLQLEQNGNGYVDVAAQRVALGEGEVEAEISRGGRGAGRRSS